MARARPDALSLVPRREQSIELIVHTPGLLGELVEMAAYAHLLQPVSFLSATLQEQSQKRNKKTLGCAGKERQGGKENMASSPRDE